MYYNGVSSSKNIKKFISIILAVLIIGVIVYFLYSKLNNKSTADLNAIFDPDKPIIVKDNDLYGYITSNGKVMIEPKYKSAYDFYGDYAIVTVDNTDENLSSAFNKIYQIIDKKGNVKLSTMYSPEYDAKYGIWIVDGVLYNSKLKRISSEDVVVDYIDYGYSTYLNSKTKEFGIINHKGKVISKLAGYGTVDISSTSYDTNELFANITSSSNGNLGEVIISLKSGDVLFTLDDPENYSLLVEDDGIFYYYKSGDYKNKTWLYFYKNKLAYEIDSAYDMEVYDYENQILEIDYGSDYRNIGKSKRYYYYDVKNGKMLDEKPSSVSLSDVLMSLNYGYSEYSCSGKSGLMIDDEIIIPCEYNDIEFLNVNLFNYMKSKGKELVLLTKDKKTILMNIKNKKIIETFDSTYVYDYSNSTFIKVILYGEDGYTISGYLIYNLLSGKSMTFKKDDTISVKSNYITHTKDDEIIYYNTDFKQIYVANK